MFYVLLAIAICLTAMGYWFRRPAIGFAGSGFWILLALHSYSLIVVVWDIYYGLFWLSIGFALVVALETFVLRPKKTEEEPEERLAWDDYAEGMEKYRDNMERLRRPTRKRQRERKDEESEKRKIRGMLS